MDPAWLRCSWALLKLAGMDTKHKRNSSLMIANFRCLSVKVQMGLLQEKLLTKTISDPLLADITPGQSGYSRGCEDPHLFLHGPSGQFSETLYGHSPAQDATTFFV